MLRDFPHGIKKLVFYSAMTLIVAVSLVISCLRQNVEHVFLCLLALLLFQLPNLLKRRLKLYIPPIIEAIIVTFIVCGLILGEVENFFLRFPYWDTILHTLNGIICSALSLSLVVLLNKQDRLFFRLSPVFLMIVSIAFSVMIGVL